MRRGTWAAILLAAFVVLFGPTDGLADLLGQALAGFGVGYLVCVYLPDKARAGLGVLRARREGTQ